MARNINGTTDNLAFVAGAALAGMTYGTWALILRVDDTSVDRCATCFLNSAGDTYRITPFQLNTSDAAAYDGTTWAGTFPQNVWTFVVVRKNTGSVAPRISYYRYDTGAWTHTALGSTKANFTAIGATDRIYHDTDAGERWDGDIAVQAIWKNTLPWTADTTGDNLLVASGLPFNLVWWHAAAPTALWVYDQATVTQSIPDLTGGGANQIAITGTTVSTNSVPSFGYGTVVRPRTRDVGGAPAVPSGSATGEVAADGTATGDAPSPPVVGPPTIPTSGAGRILSTPNTAGGATKTFPNLSSLTKNAGDLLIAIAVTYDGNSTNAEFSSWGGGFTEFVDQTTTATMGIGAAYKWSDGTETGTFTVTTADTSANDSQLLLLSIAGAHTTTPPEGGTIVNGTAAAANPTALNPAGWATGETTLWIAVCGAGEDSTTGSFTAPSAAPTNYTDLFATAVTADVVGGVYAALAFRLLDTASEDVGAFTVDTSQARNSALLIAVRSAPEAMEGAASGGVTAAGTATGSAPERGTATGTVTIAGSATGTQPAAPNAGAATGTLTAAGSSTGKSPNRGLTTGALTITGTVVGDAPTVGAKEGSATGTVSAAGSAVGAVAHSGYYAHVVDISDAGTTSTPPTDISDAGTTATPPTDISDAELAGTDLAITGTATGVQPVAGAPNEGNTFATLTAAGTATGTVAHRGATTGALATAGTATGTVPHRGSTTGTLTAAGTATGKAPKGGQTSGAVLAAGSATGTATKRGTATGSLTAAGSATGTRPVVGAKSGSTFGIVAFAGTATGTKTQRGATTGTLTTAGSATGKAPNRGATTGTLATTGTATGSSPKRGATTGTLTTAGSATGTAPIVGVKQGFVTGTLATTGTATGAVPHRGATTGAVALAGTAAGTAPVVGSKNGSTFGTVLLAGTATGQRGIPVGTATGTLATTGTATGARASRGIADIGDLQFVGTATGATIRIPGIPVLLIDPTHNVQVLDMAHNIQVRDPAQTITVTDPSHAYILTTNGQYSAGVQDTAKTETLTDPDHKLTLA